MREDLAWAPLGTARHYLGNHDRARSDNVQGREHPAGPVGAFSTGLRHRLHYRVVRHVEVV